MLMFITIPHYVLLRDTSDLSVNHLQREPVLLPTGRPLSPVQLGFQLASFNIHIQIKQPSAVIQCRQLKS